MAGERRRALVAVWLTAAMGGGALLVGARAARSGLDDPDPARQRPGFLNAGELPQPAPPLNGALPQPGRASVVFFVRPRDVSPLCRALASSSLVRHASVVVAVSGSGPNRCDGVATIDDVSVRLAAAYGLARPRSGEEPVGYAVIDGAGRIRYRTLDPAVADNLAEVATIVRALP